ncbi:MAG: cytochrome P460 family protein [Gemmatimonadota bacterium]
MRRFSGSVLALLGAVLLATAILHPFPARAGGGEASPIFGVTIPDGYRNWQLVAVSHRTDNDQVRAILGNDIAMKAYRENTLPFPDGAILAKLEWKRVESAEFKNAFVPGAPVQIEFMVKDAGKYGKTGGWGFGRFIGGKPADAQAHGTCFPCHSANVKNHDIVFTRYAP